MRTDPRRLAGHQEPSPLARYGAAKETFLASLGELIAATEALADSCGADRTGFAEMGRLSCHIAVDQAHDEVILTYPEPTQIVPRTAAYMDLLHALRDGARP